MARKLAGIVVAALLAACASYKVTPISAASATAGGTIAVLHSPPARPYVALGNVQVKKYKPGFSDPTVTDAIPDIQAAGAELGADAVIVRSSLSNGSRLVTIEGEAIRYTAEAPPSPAVAKVAQSFGAAPAAAPAAEAPRGDISERECAPITIESMRADCVRRLRAARGDTDCSLDGPMYVASRRVDRITDENSCTVLLSHNHGKSDGSPIVIFARGGMSFGVMGDDFPGEKEAIRVDSNPAYVFDDFLSGDRAKRLLNEIRSGKNLTTRYSEWPYHVNRDRTLQICNLAEAIDECRR